jgi:hypothetical protein
MILHSSLSISLDRGYFIVFVEVEIQRENMKIATEIEDWINQPRDFKLSHISPILIPYSCTYIYNIYIYYILILYLGADAMSHAPSPIPALAGPTTWTTWTRPSHPPRVTLDQGNRTWACSPTVFIGLGFHHITFLSPPIPSATRSPSPLGFRRRPGFTIKQRYTQILSALGFHSDSSVS